MNIGKLCDYLYDTGIIDIESIDNFSEIHKKIMNNNNDNSRNNCEKIKLTLSSYLSQKLNSKQNLNKFSQNIIKSFTDKLLINRYSGIKLLYSILFSKLRSIYILFFSKINFFIFNKKCNDPILEIKKGRIIKSKNSKIYNNNNKNNERKLSLNFDYDLNKKPIQLDHEIFLKIKNKNIELEKKAKEEEEKEKEEERKKEEEEKKEMEKLKIVRKTFFPGFTLNTKEIWEQKHSEEYHKKYWNTNYINKVSPKKKKVNFHSLEKKKLEEIHKKYVGNKIKKEKKEKKAKMKEDKKKMEIREKFRNIYEEKISPKDYIDRLYQKSKKKQKEENN